MLGSGKESKMCWMEEAAELPDVFMTCS